MSIKSFLQDVAQDDGFIPITPRGTAAVVKDMFDAYQQDGQQGINHALVRRYKEKGDQLVDIPYFTIDDNYSVRDGVDDLAKGASLAQDLITEIASILGAIFASLANLAPNEIDQMAEPPVEIDDVGALFLTYRTNTYGMSKFYLPDSPGLFPFPPGYLIFGDAHALIQSAFSATRLFPEMMRFEGKVFPWHNGNPRTGRWCQRIRQSPGLYDDASLEWVDPRSI
jgi:hypothetical protein